MSRARLLPHLTVSSEAVVWGPWWASVGDDRQLVEDQVKGWDYSTELAFEIQPSVDVTRALRSAGIQHAHEVSLVAQADCVATGVRFTASLGLEHVEAGEGNVLRLVVPAGTVAQKVDLTAHLVLAGTGAPSDTGRAWRTGSRLAASAKTSVRLEGEEPRFPTEAVSFDALGLGSAVWTVQVRCVDLSDAFLATVRLLVNSDHPAAPAVVDPSSEHGAVLQDVLALDVVRQMFVAVAHEEFDTSRSGEWEEGSVGQVLETLARGSLGSDLSSVVRLVTTDPAQFERRLQEGLDFLVKVR